MKEEHSSNLIPFAQPVPPPRRKIDPETDEEEPISPTENLWMNYKQGLFDKTDPDATAEAFAVRMVLRYRKDLDPWLSFPYAACHRFGPDDTPTPIGVLLRVWDRWDLITGVCRDCCGTIYGYGFTGHWHQVGIAGACIGCNQRHVRSLNNLGHVNHYLNLHLTRSPFDEFHCSGPAKPRWDIFFDAVRPLLARDQATLDELKVKQVKAVRRQERANLKAFRSLPEAPSGLL